MLFGRVIEGVGRSLDLFLRRHALVTQNLAHLDTPGYIPKDLDFAHALEAAFRKPGPKVTLRPGHLPLSSPFEEGRVEEDLRSAPGRDGNAVDLDRETTRMVENSLRFDAASRILAHKLALLKYVVTEGGK
jgi:flagellar basal-body rod protein FlgB